MMIKMMMCLTRNPDMSREAFMDYWQNSHGPFFMKNAHVMRAKKYVQSQLIDSPLNDGLQASRGMKAPYDGVAEVWFESEEELMAAMGSEAMADLGKLLLEDEQKFIDHAKSCAFIVNEVEF